MRSPETRPKSQSDMPLISVCLPNLNTRPFLEERIKTLLAQALTDWELIICNSDSHDGSWEFFEKFKHDKRVRLHQVPREGLYAGWNECLMRVRGKFIDGTPAPKLLRLPNRSSRRCPATPAERLAESLALFQAARSRTTTHSAQPTRSSRLSNMPVPPNR